MSKATVALAGLGVRVGLIGLCASAAACGAAGPPSGAASTSPTSYTGTWRLTDGRGPNGEVPLVKGYRITLHLAGNEIGGTAACNTYGAKVEIEDDSFGLADGLSGTEMACEPQVMDSEAAYLDALSEVEAIARAGKTLTLTGRDTELRFELLPAPPTAELTDTMWYLESLIEGTGSQTTARSADRARLVLRSDGTLSGSTGCREFEGEWIERGDEIIFARLAVEGHCPEELRQQDGHVLGVLGDGFTARIEGHIVMLLDQGDLGLAYRAESKR